jgi:hypothetical protein
MTNDAGRIHGECSRGRRAWSGRYWGSNGGSRLEDGELCPMIEVWRRGTTRRYAARGEVCFDVAGEPGSLVVGCERILPILGLERVDVDRSVGRLCGNVFVERVPGDALDIVAMLGDLTDKGS